MKRVKITKNSQTRRRAIKRQAGRIIPASMQGLFGRVKNQGLGPESNSGRDSLAGWLKREPENVQVRVRLALQLWQQGQQAQAIATVNDGLRLSGEDSMLAHCLGMFHAENEEYQLAEEWFCRALRRDYRRVESHYWLGMTYAAQEKYDLAFQSFQQAAQLRGDDKAIRQALTLAANCAGKMGKRRAMYLFEQCRDEVDISDGSVIDDLAEMIIAEPEYVKCLIYQKRSGDSRQEQGRLLEAVERALERCPAHADLHYYCGMIHEKLGNWVKAVQSLRCALRINPDYNQAQITLGKIYQRNRKLPRARKVLEQAVAGGARYADVYVMLGRISQAMGQLDQAKAEYNEALTINANYQQASKALEEIGV
ncbi:MAG: tetratricopeptide repeat protein [Phycisphaerae bacterium]|nr:tetratricopeptide repeat protein [Phycisphaerae bacterium]